MARPRNAPAKKYYAWSEIYNGGESEEVRPGRRVITSRNVIALGAEISQSDLGVEDDHWQHLIDTGVVREYPHPEGYLDDEGNPTDDALGMSPYSYVLEEQRKRLEAAESDAEAESPEDALIRASVVGTQVFGPSPEEVLMGVDNPEGVEEVEES